MILLGHILKYINIRNYRILSVISRIQLFIGNIEHMSSTKPYTEDTGVGVLAICIGQFMWNWVIPRPAANVLTFNRIARFNDGTDI